MNIMDRIADKLFGPYIERRISEATSATDADEARWKSLAQTAQDVPWITTRDNIAESLAAYRANPLAFRIIELTTSYVLGRGLSIDAAPQRVNTFVQQFWTHPLNAMPSRIYELLNEISITGDLFVTFHTNAYDGMTYVRVIPSQLIDEIETAPNDASQELRYHQIASLPAATATGALTRTQPDSDRWWTPDEMHHYSINRMAGTTRGQGDLVTILPWLRRYKDWLTDRVIINKYKSAYLWDVTLTGANEATVKAKQQAMAVPPAPGSVIYHNEAETWKAIKPEIGADDVSEDGKAMRTIIATGAGLPLHFLSEGSDVNRATATEMGEPTRRHYEKRQLVLRAIITDILTTAIERARAAGSLTVSSRKYTLDVEFPDLTTTDNLQLAQATGAAINALQLARNEGWLDDVTARAWLYTFAQQPLPHTPIAPHDDPPTGDNTNDATGTSAAEGAQKSRPV
jgi:hypothetical protein